MNQPNKAPPKLHVPGSYPAKVMDYKVERTKTGTAYISVLFKYQDSAGATKTITYFGNFHKNSLKYTIGALINCGWNGKGPDRLNNGKGSGALDETKVVEIVISNEPNPKNGQIQSRVQWVNAVGGGAFKERMSEGEAKVLLGGLNLEAEYMAVKEGKPESKPAAPAGGQVAAAMNLAADVFSEEEIPF